MGATYGTLVYQVKGAGTFFDNQRLSNWRAGSPRGCGGMDDKGIYMGSTLKS